MSNARLTAVLILSEVLDKKSSLTEGFETHLKGGDEVALCKALCFGVCRHYHALQVIALSLVTKRPKDTKVWAILLSGLYQLIHMTMPEYAIVQEMVATAKPLKCVWAKGLINGVLRSFCRKSVDIAQNLAENNAYRYSHPSWLLKRLKKAWPTQWACIVCKNNEQAPMSLRVNQNHSTGIEYASVLEAQGIAVDSVQEHAICLAQACEVSQLPGFFEGQVSVQDLAAQQAARLMNLTSQDRVLDACCAPGGKTGHMLEREASIDCTALDVCERRLQKVRDNLSRLTLHATLLVGDAGAPDTWWDGRCFDKILLDAPCSATGVIRRHPDIKLLRTSEDVRKICQVQQRLLHNLWPLLKPGGLLVYATCSILPEENDQQIAAFLHSHDDARLVGINETWGLKTPYGWQLLPGESDGFYYSRLKKLS